MFVLGSLLLGGNARAERLPCREDDRLAEAAAELLLRGDAIAPAELMDAVRAQGYDGVSVHARESGDEATLRGWMSALSRADEGSLECGEARTASRRLVVAARRLGRLLRDGRKVRGELAAGYSAPQLVIESAEGELVGLRISLAQLEAGIALPEGALPRRIQLVAESASGPRPVAELVLTRSARSAATTAVAKPRQREAVWGELQAFRRSIAVGALRDNRLLSESAQRHASRICELGKLAHLVEGEDPELRLRREHVVARGVGEALARAESLDRAWRALLESPVHRMAISRRDFTDAGLGEATDKKGQTCLVVLMASWPRRLP